ncbi:four-carbon acid sugar kinase family protein [Halogeometricum sp. S1BR25-6]|uniref:Four-carbon acid sugar kinase family protein n=1 Tax=Halogeometricum salsisoli TaxID=2950536 RepID=A0ABU2GHT8_9EURY|nr:four-carbon acid sugar kinase family protein [Halogeometricum sp. S1BR25-6]MDS0300344.1 four-carbon acid sugar kinase family protein [Halogeometricum sp. S1BR25-6]
MYSVIVVADDLTGAMDTSQGFAARGYEAAVVADPEADKGAVEEEGAVLGINTDTRYDDEGDAARSVSEAVEATPARTVYKKIDSTLRGNFAAEVDAALDAAGSELALVAPAFPSIGRTTEDGVHYVDGTPVSETEYGDDEKGPASSSIPELFASVDRPVETVSHAAVVSGDDGIAAAVERYDRPPVVVCDAVEDDHLADIAAAADGLDALYVGSGGLAAHVPVRGSEPDFESSRRFSEGGALGVVGSVSATTLAQLERVPEEAVVPVDGTDLVVGEEPDAAVERAVRRLREGRPAVLTAATDESTIERTHAAGREAGLASAAVRERVASGLASAAADVLDEEPPSGLLLTGGDIAVAVIRELGATTIRLTGEEVEAGIPLGTFADGRAAEVPLVTKAGGFGSEETIVNCLAVFSEDDA